MLQYKPKPQKTQKTNQKIAQNSHKSTSTKLSHQTREEERSKDVVIWHSLRFHKTTIISLDTHPHGGKEVEVSSEKYR
jgi:hypothetical protein